MAEAFDLQAEEYQAVPLPPFTGGVNSAYPADAIADNQLASANNFVVRDGVVTQRAGYETILGSALGSTVAAITEFQPFAGTALLVVHTQGSFYYLNSAATAWVHVTGTAPRTSPQQDQPWFTPMRTETAGLLLLSGNRIDGLAGWSGSTAATFSVISTAVLGGCGVVWRGHLLQGDVTTPADGRVSTRAQWSALGQPQTWTGTASTGTIDLLDENASRIQCFVPMRTSLLAYKEVGVHALGYKGHPFYFTQGVLHGQLTCLSRRAVAPIQNGDRHLVVTQENIVLWDGSSIERVGDPIVSQFFGELNWAARDAVWAVYSSLTEEVLIGVPTGASTTPNKVWVYNLRYGSWWPQDFGFLSALEARRAFSPIRLLVGHADQRLYQLWTGRRDGVGLATISSSLQTKAYDFGSAAAQKRLKKVAGLFGAGTAATVTVSLQRAAVENILALSTNFDTATTISAAIGNNESAFDKQASGKWLAFRLSHTAANATVAVHRLLPYIQGRTTRRQNRG